MTKLTTTYVRVSGQTVNYSYGVKNYFFHDVPASFREVAQHPDVKRDFLSVTNAVLVTRVVETTESPIL